MAKVKSTNDGNMPPRSQAGRTGLIRPTDMGGNAKPVGQRRVAKSLGIQATRKQLPLSRRIARSLLNDESAGIGSYILYDILIPAAKSMITESIQSGIEMMLYGEAGGRRSPSRNRNAGGPVVNYGAYSNTRDSRDPRRYDPKPNRFARGKFNLDEIIFKNGSDASDVLSALCDHIENYEAVSVSEFYDYAGVEGATFTDNKWGWTGSELSDAYCTHTRGGYVIVLPEPKELE